MDRMDERYPSLHFAAQEAMATFLDLERDTGDALVARMAWG